MNDIVLNTNKSKTFLFLQTDDNRYMIDSECVKKIVILQTLECPKSLPKHVLGLLEYEGEFINILNLRSILGLEIKPYPLNSKIIIINCNDMNFGIITEDVSDIKRVKPNLIKDTPYNKGEIVHQIYSPKSDLSTLVIDINSVYETLKKTLDENVFEETTVNLLPKNQNELEILKERTLSTKQKSELKTYSVASTDTTYITFKIEDKRYCIKNTYIKEFFKLNKTKITRIPSTPDFIKGIINIKGDFICVLDIQKYLNRGEILIDDKSNVIVLNSDKVKLGILTNGISKNMNFDNIDFGLNECIDVVQNDKIYCILNIESIIDSEKLYVK